MPGGGRGHSPTIAQVQVKVGDKATEMAARIAGALKSARTLGHNLTPHQNHEEGENCQPTEISTAAMWTKRALRTYTLTPRVHF